MTIASIYLSPEGVVFGADSTASHGIENGLHFFNFNQKLYEIGEDSTLGLLTWGLGSIGRLSYRTLIAELADSLKAKAPTSVSDVVQRWTQLFWGHYAADTAFVRHQTLAQMAPFGQAATAAGARTEDEEKEFSMLGAGLIVGFCIAGYTLPSRSPEALSVTFRPQAAQPTPNVVQMHTLNWWGVPNFFTRSMMGLDDNLTQAIVASGKWTGTPGELQQIAQSQAVVPRTALPIRDAVDYVHTCIYSTVKALKFSGLPQVCGGPIELAVVTTDRRFRWIRHKPWDSAILDGALL